MYARFECLFGCVGIYHGSYYFGSVRDYLYQVYKVFWQVHGHSTASLASFTVNFLLSCYCLFQYIILRHVDLCCPLASSNN